MIFTQWVKKISDPQILEINKYEICIISPDRKHSVQILTVALTFAS